MTSQLVCYLTHSLCVASPGSVPVALAVAACILALLSLPLILVLVYKQRQNAQSSRRMYHWYAQASAHTHSFPCSCYDSNINLSHKDTHSVLSDTYFLSVRQINCISHSRKHIHTPSVVFRSVSIHSQWPISRFLSPRCTGAGEDGQVSFPTVCQAAGYTDQLQNTAALQNNNNVYIDILLCSCQKYSHTIATFCQATWFNQNMLQLCG